MTSFKVDTKHVKSIKSFIEKRCSEQKVTDELNKYTGYAGPIGAAGDFKTEKAKVEIGYDKKTNEVLIKLILTESAEVVWRMTNKRTKKKYKVVHTGSLKLAPK